MHTPEHTPNPPPPPGEGGVVGRAKDVARGAGSYLRLRLQLAAIESREAGGSLAKAIGLGVGVGSCLGWASGLATAAAVWLVAEAAGYPWPYVALAFAALHLVIAAGLALAARRYLRRPYFPETIRQFQLDQECLKTDIDQPRP